MIAIEKRVELLEKAFDKVKSIFNPRVTLQSIEKWGKEIVLIKYSFNDKHGQEQKDSWSFGDY